MRGKGVTILLVMVLGSAFINTVGVAQEPLEGWDIELGQPFYFVGDDLNGTVIGYANTNYSLYLVNTTNWTSLPLVSGFTGPMGENNFNVRLFEDWVQPGRYSLNVTVDGYVVCFTKVTIDYSEEFLHEKEHDWIREMLSWLERAVTGITRDINTLWEDMGVLGRAVLFLFIAFIIIAGQTVQHVHFPRFYAWAQFKQMKSWHKRRQIGLKANTKQWHRKEPTSYAADRRPVLNDMAQNLTDIDVPPEMAKAVVWEGTGNPGEGDYVRGVVKKAKMSRLGKKARWRLQNLKEKDANFVYTLYLEDRIDELHERIKRVEEINPKKQEKPDKKPSKIKGIFGRLKTRRRKG